MNIIDLLNWADGAGYLLVKQVVSLTWQSTLVLGCALLLTWLFKHYSAASRSLLLMLALLTLPLIPLSTLLINQVGAPQMELRILPDYQPRVIPTADPLTGPLVEETKESAIAPLAAAISTGIDRQPHSFQQPWALAAGLLLLGALFFLGSLLGGWQRLLSWRRTACPVTDPKLLALFQDAARQLDLRRNFELLTSAAVETPLTTGTLNPIVLLPTRLPRTLSESELNDIALHELAHLKRCDPLIFSSAAILRALLFFNPLVWITAWRLGQLAEQCCDETVLSSTSDPVRYARMLTGIAEALPQRRLKMELSAGFVLTRKVFKKRIEAILTRRHRDQRGLSRIHLVMILALLTLSFLVAIATPVNSRLLPELNDFTTLEMGKMTVLLAPGELQQDAGRILIETDCGVLRECNDFILMDETCQPAVKVIMVNEPGEQGIAVSSVCDAVELCDTALLSAGDCILPSPGDAGGCVQSAGRDIQIAKFCLQDAAACVKVAGACLPQGETCLPATEEGLLDSGSESGVIILKTVGKRTVGTITTTTGGSECATLAVQASGSACAALATPALPDDLEVETYGKMGTKFNQVSTGMNSAEVLELFGPPDETVELEQYADRAFVWKRKALWWTKEMVVTVFRGDTLVMATHSTGGLDKPVDQHVYEVLSQKDSSLLPSLPEIPACTATVEMRHNLNQMLMELGNSGGLLVTVDKQTAEQFNAITFDLGYEQVVSLLGKPTGQDSGLGKMTHLWERENETISVTFKKKGDRMLEKQFFNDLQKIIVDTDSWQASSTDGDTTVRLIVEE